MANHLATSKNLHPNRFSFPRVSTPLSFFLEHSKLATTISFPTSNTHRSCHIKPFPLRHQRPTAIKTRQFNCSPSQDNSALHANKTKQNIATLNPKTSIIHNLSCAAFPYVPFRPTLSALLRSYQQQLPLSTNSPFPPRHN